VTEGEGVRRGRERSDDRGVAPARRSRWARWDGRGTNLALFSERGVGRALRTSSTPTTTRPRIEVRNGPRSTGTATCREWARASGTATGCTGPTTLLPVIASTRPSS
jgi:hypothetical protein